MQYQALVMQPKSINIELRTFFFNFEMKHLTIWDCLEYSIMCDIKRKSLYLILILFFFLFYIFFLLLSHTSIPVGTFFERQSMSQLSDSRYFMLCFVGQSIWLFDGVVFFNTSKYGLRWGKIKTTVTWICYVHKSSLDSGFPTIFRITFQFFIRASMDVFTTRR